MIRLPRNKVPCYNRSCGTNCNHAFDDHCVVPNVETTSLFSVEYRQQCQHTDKTYEQGMQCLENIEGNPLSAETLIRHRFNIPNDQPITDIDLRNYDTICMAEAHAVFNMRPPAVLL